VQHALIHDLLSTCRQAPGALAAVVPHLDGGAGALMRALRRGGGGGGAGEGVVMPRLALPVVVEETLTVTQVGVGGERGVEGCVWGGRAGYEGRKEGRKEGRAPGCLPAWLTG
jgi:hypothetical protein